MRKHLIRILNLVYQFLARVLDSLKENSSKIKFNSLSPTAEVENSEIYHEALNWALENREAEDIKNIAITGYYGSGKSSVIKSFINKNRHRYKFLPLSLATFKDENNSSDPEQSIKEIEESILQQIFYKVPDEKIPDSRFSKISSRTFLKYIVFSAPIVLFLLCLLLFYIPSFNTSLGWNLSQQQIVYGFIISGSISVFLILWKLKDLTLSKFSVKNLEVDLAEKNNDLSVLNTYIDEIIYFFKRTKYQIVVIEDIDRFETTEIFTKLREINLILNNSEITKNLHIVFIYAIKDDQFQNKKDRTKFFDFILPVIPVINLNNSIDKILKIRDNYELGISNKLVKELAIYIDDMRLLLNIFNEFLIYFNQIKDVSSDRLFAMVIYKNLLPDDFALLAQGEGLLYAIFDKKKSIVENKVQDFEDRIEKIEDKNTKIEQHSIKSVEELRSIYLLEYIKSLSDKHNHDFQTFIKDDIKLSIEEMKQDENFKLLVENQILYVSSRFGAKRFDIRFEEIEKKVDKNTAYKDREELILKKLNNQIEINNRQIAEIELNIIDLSKSNLNEIISDPIIEDTLKDYFLTNPESEYHSKNTENELKGLLKQKLPLLQSLILNGFIDEDYFMYISIFYEERLTRKDFQYIQNVKNLKKSEYDYNLTKVSEVVEFLSPRNLESDFIYNRDLTNYLLSSKDHSEEGKILLDAISKCNEQALDFISYFVKNTSYQKEFIQEITKRNPTIWDEIESSKLDTISVQLLYELILKYTELNTLLNHIEKSSLEATILNDEKFLYRIDNNEKIKKIISNSGIKLEMINFEETDKDLLHFIYHNNHYAFKKSILIGFYRIQSKNIESDFLLRPYSIISQDPELVDMYNYIQSNLNRYVVDIPLRVSENVSEEELYYIELLNSEEVTFDNKVSLINKQKTIVSTPSKVEDINLVELLVKELKILPTWENVDFLSREFSEKTEVTKIPKQVAEYLSVEENSQTLKKSPVNPEKLSIENFETLLINRVDIPDLRYEDLIVNFKAQDKIDTKGLETSKIEILIKRGKMLLSEENLIELRKRNSELVIDLLVKWKDEFLLEVDEYKLTPEELKYVLKSSNFNPVEKSNVLESQKEVNLDEELMVLVANLILDEKQFSAPLSIIFKLTSVNLKIDRSIKLFNKISGKFSNDQIKEFLGNLQDPFYKLADSKSRPPIPKDEETTKMLEILESKGIISSKKQEGQKYRVYKPGT